MHGEPMRERSQHSRELETAPRNESVNRPPLADMRIVSKSFVAADGVHRLILRDIGFTVSAGEVIALLGPSGTGKSTTLRILLGLDEAYEGHTRLAAKRVGVMFQEPRLLPWMDVAANIRVVVPAGQPMPDLAALLERVQLGGAASLLPRQLSLGMARRVALARALAVSPDLLVLDEPFASLDARMGAALAEVVARHAQDTASAVLMATHDLTQALQIATRVLVLAGRPATLAADIPVPREADSGAKAMLQARLLRQFAFLAGGNSAKSGPDQLPPALSVA
jgi:NitT/TauT family transport system ATP-binding protein